MMARLLVCLLATISIHSATAQAGGFGSRILHALRTSVETPLPSKPVPNRYRTPYPSVSGGFSIGMGSYPAYNYPKPGQFDPYRFDNYTYYPYQFGSFREPDLLNDPYFRERTRYDSAFPGKRYRKGR